MTELLASTAVASGTSTGLLVGANGIVTSVQFVISAAASATLQGSLNGTDWCDILTETISRLHAVTPCPYMRVSWTGNTGTLKVMVNPNV